MSGSESCDERHPHDFFVDGNAVVSEVIVYDQDLSFRLYRTRLVRLSVTRHSLKHCNDNERRVRPTWHHIAAFKVFCALLASATSIES